MAAARNYGNLVIFHPLIPTTTKQFHLPCPATNMLDPNIPSRDRPLFCEVNLSIPLSLCCFLCSFLCLFSFPLDPFINPAHFVLALGVLDGAMTSIHRAITATKRLRLGPQLVLPLCPRTQSQTTSLHLWSFPANHFCLVHIVFLVSVRPSTLFNTRFPVFTT